MYTKILLCYDGSREGRLALREGARLAQITGADVILLAGRGCRRAGPPASRFQGDPRRRPSETFRHGVGT